MAAWMGEPYDYESREDSVDVFSWCVIGFAFVALTVWAAWVLLHP
jgi:hypothetical protein